MTGTPQAIAVAAPLTDPLARVRSDLREQRHHYQVAVAKRDLRHLELARAIVAARRAGLSHRQIATVVGLATMTVHKIEHQYPDEVLYPEKGSHDE